MMTTTRDAKGKQPSEPLAMEPWDWERFDASPPPGNAYHFFMEQLGDVRGKRILDAGCGDGWLSVILAKRGARVWGFDLASESVDKARRRAELNHVEDAVSFSVSSFEEMVYEDGFFDLVAGFAILHHVNVAEVARLLAKCMKSDGRAVFLECFGNSLWLERLRLLVPVPVDDTDPTHWNKQLKYADIAKFKGDFHRVTWEEFEFFSRLDRVIRNPGCVRFLNRFDSRLFRLLPFMKRYARLVVVQLQKPKIA